MSTTPELIDDIVSGSAPDGENPEGPWAAFRRSLAGWPTVVIGLILVFGLAGNIVRVPYHSIGPGPATDVLSLIKVTGTDTYPSRGKLLLTTASVSDDALTVWESVLVWASGSYSTVPRDVIVTPGLDDEGQDARNFRDMEESKLSAELAAFRLLGKDATRIPGAKVFSVVDGSPADGDLRTGDLIVAIDGRTVTTPDDAARAIRQREPGDDVRVTIRRDGERLTAVVRTRPSAGDPAVPSVGVFLGDAYRLPVDVEIDTQEIGGPSGGLVFALALVDVLTEDDLTAGHVVAATGTIELGDDGEAVVGLIGAVGEKVRAAHAAGASVFLVPFAEAKQAQAAAPSSMKVIGVRTLSDAIEALRGLKPARS